MRVLVCCDRIGGLTSDEAGAALGRAFASARPGVQVAVVPLAVSGPDLALALAALGNDAVVVSAGPPVAGSFDPHSSTIALGSLLADALRARPRRVVLDLVGTGAMDGGAGILAALGAAADAPLGAGAAGLTTLERIDLAPVREVLGDTELVGVVAPEELGDMLLGLRGVAARRGHAVGAEPAAMLAADAALGRLASAVGVPDAPGAGAAGGAALAVLALGGWLTAGPALCAQVAGLAGTASVADVVVTGGDVLDTVHYGGAVVGEASAAAERAERPCVAVARVVAVSGRELRTLGVESAHALGGGPELTASELTRRAAGVAASWTW